MLQLTLNYLNVKPNIIIISVVNDYYDNSNVDAHTLHYNIFLYLFSELIHETHTICHDQITVRLKKKPSAKRKKM